MEDKYKKAPGDGNVKNLEELELFVKIQERTQVIVCEFVENWVSGKRVTDEEIEKIVGLISLRYVSAMEKLIKDSSQVLEFSGKKERLENVIKDWIANL